MEETSHSRKGANKRIGNGKSTNGSINTSREVKVKSDESKTVPLNARLIEGADKCSTSLMTTATTASRLNESSPLKSVAGSRVSNQAKYNSSGTFDDELHANRYKDEQRNTSFATDLSSFHRATPFPSKAVFATSETSFSRVLQAAAVKPGASSRSTNPVLKKKKKKKFHQSSPRDSKTKTFNLPPLLSNLATRLVQLDEEKRHSRETSSTPFPSSTIPQSGGEYNDSVDNVIEDESNQQSERLKFTDRPKVEAYQDDASELIDSDLDLNEVDLDLFMLHPHAAASNKVNENMKVTEIAQSCTEEQVHQQREREDKLPVNQSTAPAFKSSVRHQQQQQPLHTQGRRLNELTNRSTVREESTSRATLGSVNYRTGIYLNSIQLNSKMTKKVSPSNVGNRVSHAANNIPNEKINSPAMLTLSPGDRNQVTNHSINKVTSDHHRHIPQHPSSTHPVPSSRVNGKMNSSSKINIPFELHSTKLTPKEELSRYRRQFFFECTSLALMTLAGTIIVLLPFLMMSVWLVPLKYAKIVRLFLAASFGFAILLVICAGFIGNIYWYMDPIQRKWRWALHCGSGPSDYFWGETLFYTDSSKEYPLSVVSHHSSHLTDKTMYLPTVNVHNDLPLTSNLADLYRNDARRDQHHASSLNPLQVNLSGRM